ncbi:XRE family transcriptional regulator [Hellea balneolensis]|uniref:XRE family transcriptional regulator n=1 Tax=Hellea balneolensis TaxID=287478 RepID=UPI00047A87DB|nr:XRE family transcriptional regulator [Hellea balneolensis]
MARQKRQPCAQTDALGEKLGQTILRLRTADKMSLGDLSESSGVAKSMISQIEKNEANPSLATLSRLSQALGTSVQAIVSSGNSGSALVQKSAIQDTPLLQSEDGLCELRIIGSIDTVQWVQWYDFRAKPHGILESSAHPEGSVENLTILSGEAEVRVEGERWTVKSGETLRYKADRTHSIKNAGEVPLHATMVNILAHAVRTVS